MNKDFKKIVRKAKRFLVVMITVASFCCHSANVALASEYASLIDAIQATTTPRTYTLEANETTTTPLGDIGQWNSVLTIDGGSGNYGITNTSTANEVRLFVSKNQTVYLQNLGTYTTTTSDTIVEGVNIITDVTVGNSVNNFGKNSDRVGFLRSAGTSHISNSVFYNNRAKFGAALQNREQGTMSITGSVFVGNTSPQGAVHNDGTNRMTEISNSIFFNNTAITQASGDTDLIGRSGSAIYNKPDRIIDSISGTQFVSNTTVATTEGQRAGTIYNGGTIGEISNSVFYNNTNQRGSAINNVSSGTVTTISNTTFVQNSVTDGSGAAILNAIGSNIGTITGSRFISNTATSNGGAISNEGTITDLGGTYTSNIANSNGGAIYNTGTITTFSGTYSSNTAAGNGGALYNDGIITNTVSATFNGNMAANGGAIYNASGKTITFGTGSIFNENLASSSGGAIYNAGTTNIVASTNDITFTGNQSGVTYTYDAYNNITGHTGGIANDVHNTNVLNLNAGASHNIVFNGTITGDASSRGTINVNDSTKDSNVGGTIQFNDTVSNNRIIQEDGTIEFLNSGSTTVSAITDANTYGGTDAYMVEVNGGNLVSDTSVFANNLAGAILIATNGSAEITDSAFISNTALNGGAINNAGTISDLGGTYISNSATGNGGALYNNGTVTNAIDAIFGGNNAADGNSANSGGAIYNTTGSTLSVASTSIFNNNTATSNGGAIYNEGSITALAGTYTSNSANANGGAIYNTGTISDLSGTYTSNTATTNGGAIYNTGTVTITSSDGANTTFSGNTANGVSNALYNTGTVNMNAGTDSSIIFNDKITGSGGAITIGGNGVVEFNETVTGNSVTLNSGSLKLGSADSLENVTSFTSTGGTLDLRDGEVHNYQLGQSTSINGTVGLAIDANLAGATPVADIITAAGAVSGSGSFVFSAANIDITSYPSEQTPFWIQVTDENLRDYAGLGSSANIHITGNEPESFFVTYETSHNSVNAGFLKFEHDTLANAIASSIEEKAYVMGANETLTSTPAMGGDALSINGNSQGYSITGDGGAGLVIGNGQTLSLNNIGIDSTDNVTGTGLNNFNTAVTNNANGTLNIYNTQFSNNTTDIDNSGVVNMSGIVIFDTLTGTGTTNITSRIDGSSSTVTVNNSLEQNNINIVSGNTLTNDNATITVNTALNNAGTISGTGTSSLVINGNSSNTGTIEEGTLVVAASTSLINTGDITINNTLTNSGTITNNNDLTLQGSAMTNAGTIDGSGTTYIVGQLTNNGTISQNGIQISGAGELITNASSITATAGITNNGTLELTGGNITSEILSASGTTSITGDVTNTASHSIANAVDIQAGGTLTTNAGALLNTTSNAGTLELTGGNIINDILGASGTTNITGNVTNTDTHSIANAVDVQAGGKLTTNADALLNTTNNDGTLELTGGTVVADISGTGLLGITNDIQNSANITQGSITINNGQTLTNDSGATITTTGTAAGAGFQNNGTVLNNGTITVAGGANNGSITGSGTFTNSGDFTNSSTINQNAITNSGTITTNSENLVASSGITNNGTLVYNAGSQTVSDITGDGSANSHVELRTNAPFTINNTISNTYIDLYDSTLVFGNSGNISGATALNVNGGGMDFVDDNISSINLGTVNLNAPSNISIDFDLSTLTSDSFTATVNNNGGIFNINQVNLLGTTTQDNISINLGDTTGLGQSNVTSVTVDLPSIMTPIRKINGHIEDGWLTYTGGSSSDPSNFNPAVLATPVIAQAGIHAVMNNTFQHAYEHADWYTKFSANDRAAMLKGAPATNGGHYNQYNANSAIWFKSYATLEDVPLRSGPKADVKSYGSMLGLDSGFQDWGSDWYGVTSGYIGYNGTQIKYPEVSASTNGGLFGVTQTLYKNNFWAGVTANVGAHFADARTMYGSENSAIFTTGLGAQTGYNIELGESNFILQPIWAMNYSLIHTFSYTNAAGVKIDPKPLHTVQLNPTLRLVGNVNGWQPYASVGMGFNLMNKTDVTADSVGLPEMSIKPYLLYNVGVQKAINDNFTGFIQVAGHNGGRDGIEVVGGLRWAFGGSNKEYETVKENTYTESAINTQNVQEAKIEEPVVETQNVDVEQENVEDEEPIVEAQSTDAEQENVEAEEPVVNVQEIDDKQQETEVEEPIANTHEDNKDQEDVRTEKSVTKDQYIDRNQKDTRADKAVTSAPEVKGEQENVQAEESEEPGESSEETPKNHTWAIAIAIAAAVAFGIFLAKRKK